MSAIFVDYVPRWVPVAAGALIVIGAWFGGTLAQLGAETTALLATALFCAVFVLVFFQGRYYWRGQVKSLATDGMRYEAVTSVWIGKGRRILFVPTEARAWTIKDGPPGADGRRAPRAIRFAVRDESLELNLTNPEIFDIEALSGLNPAWFRKARAEHLLPGKAQK